MTDLPEQPTPFESRFATLEESNRMLAADVRALTAALQVINQLQREQREAAERARRTDARVGEVEKEARLRAARTQRVVGFGTLTLAVLLPLVSLIVYASLIGHVNDLLNQQAEDRLAACKQRNIGTQVNVDRERELGLLEPAGSQRRAIHLESSKKLAATAINCDALYRR